MLRFTEIVIGGDQIAFYESLQHLAERSAYGNACVFRNGLPLKTVTVSAQQLHDFPVLVVVSKQGSEQPVVLVLQESVLSKEQLVDVLRQRVSGLEIGHVIGHAAQYHIGLHEVVTVHCDATVSEILLRLGQGKRMDVHFACRSAIKPALTVNQVVKHPCSCAAADNQQQVVLAGAPAVPKVFESGEEAGARSVEPWQFIYKHHHLFLGLPP